MRTQGTGEPVFTSDAALRVDVYQERSSERSWSFTAFSTDPAHAQLELMSVMQEV